MSKKTKIWLVTAASLLLAGCGMLVGAMVETQWDLMKLFAVKYETSDHAIEEAYKNIRVHADTADLVIMPSENGETSVICREQEQAKHTVAVTEETLVIELVDEGKWYERLVTLGTPKITVYLPCGEYGSLSVTSRTGDVEVSDAFRFEQAQICVTTGDVKNYASVLQGLAIQTNTGDICVERVSAKSLDCSVTTGKVRLWDVSCRGDVAVHVSTGDTDLTNVLCKNLFSTGNTGDIALQELTAAEKISVKRTTGDVAFDSCDGGEIFVETDTGDVRGSLRSDKVFFPQTDTGRVDVPKTTAGGRCEITTDTGNITLTVEPS